MPSVDYAAGALGDRSIETAEADPAVIYALDADLRITYCNPAWDAFARANNGGHLLRPHQIGFTLMYAIPGCLREFYRQAFQSVGDREQPWDQIYECSSPTVYRACEMTIQPIAKRAGFLVISRLVIERPHAADHAPHLPLVELYAGTDGFVGMCSLCRRTQRARQPGFWDWVPAYVENPPTLVNQEICQYCFETHHSFYPIQEQRFAHHA